MKTTISIPDSLNESIETFLETTGMSRSEFFQRAARLYLETVSAKAVTANLDRVFAEEDSPGDDAFRGAAIARFRELLGNEEW